MPPKVDADIMNIIYMLDHPQRLSLLNHVTNPFLRGVLVSHLKTLLQEETDRLIAIETLKQCDFTASGSSGSSGSSGCSGPAPPPPLADSAPTIATSTPTAPFPLSPSPTHSPTH